MTIKQEEVEVSQSKPNKPKSTVKSGDKGRFNHEDTIVIDRDGNFSSTE